MKNKLYICILIGILAISLTGCGSSSNNVTLDLKKIYDDCMTQNDGSVCKMNWTFQNYLETYSSFRLLNTSNKEFTVKPQEPNSLFTYGASRDGICAYKYALFYNKDTNSYYSVEIECANNDADPVFVSAKNLDNGKVDKLPDSEKKESTKDNNNNNETNNTNTNNNNSNSNNNDSNSNTVKNDTNTTNEVKGLKIGNYTMKYGTYEGQDASSGIKLVIKEDGTCTYDGKNGTYTIGKHDFAQDISSQGHPVDSITIKTDYEYYFYPESNTAFTDGGINRFIYLN